jgi:GNAT superfamily N-acetyltransferase
MEIQDLSAPFVETYVHCLEDWSDEIKEAGDHKGLWYERMKDRGLRVKLAVADGQAVGMIQYVPVELGYAEGRDLYSILCIWVHGRKQGVGNRQKRGLGTALLRAAEEDAKALGAKGMTAWGVSLPFFMRASWFRKHGYLKADKNGMSVLLWKPFDPSAEAPRWIREKKRPAAGEGKTRVTAFVSGWCPAMAMVFERARRAAAEFGGAVEFQDIATADRAVFLDWGIADGLFIDGRPVRTGPPPSYKKIRRKIARRVKKVKPRMPDRVCPG